jgi:hypothetical protein
MYKHKPTLLAAAKNDSSSSKSSFAAPAGFATATAVDVGAAAIAADVDVALTVRPAEVGGVTPRAAAAVELDCDMGGSWKFREVHESE